jgi:hypothetical protein
VVLFQLLPSTKEILITKRKGTFLSEFSVNHVSYVNL